jgi:hypothetical protein
VSSVSFLYNGKYLRDIEFGHPDSSNTKICGYTNCNSRKTKVIVGNLLGMAVADRFDEVDVSDDELSVWDDSGVIPC